MLIDLVAVGLALGLTVLGAVRGTLASVLKIAALLLAYVSAYFASTRLAEVAATGLGLHPLLGVAVVGTVAFAGTYVIASLVARWLLRRDRRAHEDRARGGLDRLGGAVAGAAQGALVALMIGWLGLWLDAARSLEVGPGAEVAVPEPSLLGWASQVVVERGAEAALGDRLGGRVAVNLMARPGQTLTGLQRVLDNPRISALQEDRLFWQYVASGATDQALNQASFLGIAYDSTLRGELADLGLVGESARADARLFRNATREVLDQMAPALEELKNDPALQELVADPEIQAALQNGNTVVLLQHPGFRALVQRVLDRAEL